MTEPDSCPVRIEFMTNNPSDVKVRHSAEHDCLDYARYLSLFYNTTYIVVEVGGIHWRWVRDKS